MRITSTDTCTLPTTVPRYRGHYVVTLPICLTFSVVMSTIWGLSTATGILFGNTLNYMWWHVLHIPKKLRNIVLIRTLLGLPCNPEGCLVIPILYSHHQSLCVLFHISRSTQHTYAFRARRDYRHTETALGHGLLSGESMLSPSGCSSGPDFALSNQPEII